VLHWHRGRKDSGVIAAAEVVELDSEHVHPVMHDGGGGKAATIGDRLSQDPSTHTP
jgi:hypothetical protein